MALMPASAVLVCQPSYPNGHAGYTNNACVVPAAARSVQEKYETAKTTTTVCKDYANDHRCSHSFRARTTPDGWVDEPTVSRIDEWRAHRLLDGLVDCCLILIKP